jgi:hypothetical protein
MTTKENIKIILMVNTGVKNEGTVSFVLWKYDKAKEFGLRVMVSLCQETHPPRAVATASSNSSQILFLNHGFTVHFKMGDETAVVDMPLKRYIGI